MKKLFILFIISFNAYAFNITPGISGSWYDNSNSGQGFNIEVVDNNRIIIYWYSYDQGNPIWLVGSGTYQGNTSTLELSYFQGSNFGINHQANLVSKQSFGNATFTFDDCNSGSMSYNSSITGFGSGSINLDRLTKISSLPCVNDINTIKKFNSITYQAEFYERNMLIIDIDNDSDLDIVLPSGSTFINNSKGIFFQVRILDRMLMHLG